MTTASTEIWNMPIHPAARYFPKMTDEQFNALVKDIEKNGVLEPVHVYKGQLLDGRHRRDACLKACKPCPTQEYTGNNPYGFVLSVNLNRRHLNTSQRALVATKFATRNKGKPASLRINENDDLPPTQETAAQQLNVSPRAVQTAKRVLEYAAPDIVEAVELGNMSLAAAEKTIAPIPVIVTITKNIVTTEQWAGLSLSEQKDILATAPSGKFNLQDNDAIGWAAYSWNPITGCWQGCEYCYAKDIATRFYGDIGFTPALHAERLRIPFGTQPKANNNRVFTVSMGDLFGADIPDAWIQTILENCAQSDYTFLMLTKNPARLEYFLFPENVWVGTTCDTQRRMDVAEKIFPRVQATVKWVSVEPMLEAITPTNPETFDWFVIGGASPSSGQPGFIPPWAWVFRLALAANSAGRKVWVKGSIGLGAGLPRELPA